MKNYSQVLESDLENIVCRLDDINLLKNASILVTGVTGFLGSIFIKTILLADEKYNLGVKIVGIVRDKNKVKKVFDDRLIDKIVFFDDWGGLKDICFDFIIHAAAPTQSSYFISFPVETLDSMMVGIHQVLELAKQNNNCKVVYLSSMEQYGIPYENGASMDEQSIGVIDHLTPRSSYSLGKRVCECYCSAYATEYDVDVKIARLSQTFGPGASLTDNRVFMQFARSVIKNENIILHTDGSSVSNFCYITDAICGIFLVLFLGKKGEAYNICNDKETRTIKEIAELVSDKVASGKIKVEYDIPIESNYGYAPIVNMFLCSDKLKSLGWKAEVSMEKAYERLVCYLKEIESFQ